MMRAPTLIVTVWQPWLSRKSLLQTSLSSQSSIKKQTCLMAKEEERKVKTKGISSSKYVSSDNNDDSAPFPNGLNEKRVIKK
jgi:hypothetical protein